MFETPIKLAGDLARKVEREARQRDLDPAAVVAELVTLGMAVRHFARRVHGGDFESWRNSRQTMRAGTSGDVK